MTTPTPDREALLALADRLSSCLSEVFTNFNAVNSLSWTNRVGDALAQYAALSLALAGDRP